MIVRGRSPGTSRVVVGSASGWRRAPRSAPSPARAVRSPGRPAERAERPQGAREPGVEHVRILHEPAPRAWPRACLGRLVAQADQQIEALGALQRSSRSRSWSVPSSAATHAQTPSPRRSAQRPQALASSPSAKLRSRSGSGAPTELAADAPVALLGQPALVGRRERSGWNARARPTASAGGMGGIERDLGEALRHELPAVPRRTRIEPSTSPMRTNHCRERYGSIGVRERSEWPSSIVRSSTFSIRPRRSRSATTRSRATIRSSPA